MFSYVIIISGSEIKKRTKPEKLELCAILLCWGDGIGRHTGLKILRVFRLMRVQVPLPAPLTRSRAAAARQLHRLKVVGSNPTSATTWEDTEAVKRDGL